MNQIKRKILWAQVQLLVAILACMALESKADVIPVDGVVVSLEETYGQGADSDVHDYESGAPVYFGFSSNWFKHLGGGNFGLYDIAQRSWGEFDRFYRLDTNNWSDDKTYRLIVRQSMTAKLAYI